MKRIIPDSLNVSPTCQIQKLSEIYETYLEQRGTFVEVGAHDGYMASNTSCLAELGWRGIYVEPDKVLAEQCKLRNLHYDIEVYCYAISDKNGVVDFHRVQGGLSTASAETRSAHKEILWAKDAEHIESTIAPAITLDSLLLSAKVEPNFDLLVVDVEGFEEKVFLGFNISHYKPKMIIVELCDYHPSFDPYPSLQASARRVRNHILASDYVTVYADPINSVFVAREGIHLKALALDEL